jgi:DNA segregation ATPase FtsK/SpoIIIE, S-DNA-T family
MSQIENLNHILRSYKIKADCTNYSKIRNVSLYDLRLEPGARIRELQKFADEISLSLKAKTRPLVRIMSDLGIVRLEVVDEKPHLISYFDDIQKLSIPDGSVPMYFGSSVNGQSMWVDMAKNPHLLLAGTTGSGKSTLLHTIMANAFRMNVKICLIDSKNVEFNEYKKFSNVSIANDYISGLDLLDILIDEMEYRYTLMNKGEIQNGSALEFENTLFIVDEFADLIMQDDSKIFFNRLCRLAQKSRAAKIYCILATQRPSVDVIRGSIKANFPARISCQVASSVDSKVILDTGGAELLAGCGDAIIKNYNNNYQRFQIAHTTPEEICKFYG